MSMNQIDDCSYRKSHAPDVRLQLDAFDDQREADEELTYHGPPGIDLSSHVDVFYAILGQVSDFQRFPYFSASDILENFLRPILEELIIHLCAICPFYLKQALISSFIFIFIKLPRHSILIKAIENLLIETSAARERRLIKRSTPTDRRHSAGDTLPECLAASAAAGPKRRRQRSGMGHRGNSGSSSYVAGESRGRYQIAEVA